MSGTGAQGLTLHEADVLLPMGGERPKPRGALLLDDTGTIVAVGTSSELQRRADRRVQHHVLMPGLINAHTHLVDAGCKAPVKGGEGLLPWVRTLLAEREHRAETTDPKSIEHEIDDTLASMSRTGTVAVGEVTNDLFTLPAVRRSGMRARVIHEALGWSISHREHIRDSIRSARETESWDDTIAHGYGAHAPYSVSPELLTDLLEDARANASPLYIHLAEDPAERELYVFGGGAWSEYLHEIGVWDREWYGSGVSPIEMYDSHGLLNHSLVCVHLADATRNELALLARRGARAILSPSSNLHITGLLPDVSTMVQTGLTFAFGTDGRASNASIDVVDEARVIADRFPWLPPGILLEGLTWRGAEILGMASLGRLRPGCAPGLVSVELSECDTDMRQLERRILFESRARRRVA